VLVCHCILSMMKRKREPKEIEKELRDGATAMDSPALLQYERVRGTTEREKLRERERVKLEARVRMRAQEKRRHPATKRHAGDRSLTWQCCALQTVLILLCRCVGA
jgi:hypothetical protein